MSQREDEQERHPKAPFRDNEIFNGHLGTFTTTRVLMPVLDAGLSDLTSSKRDIPPLNRANTVANQLPPRGEHRGNQPPRPGSSRPRSTSVRPSNSYGPTTHALDDEGERAASAHEDNGREPNPHSSKNNQSHRPTSRGERSEPSHSHVRIRSSTQLGDGVYFRVSVTSGSRRFNDHQSVHSWDWGDFIGLGGQQHFPNVASISRGPTIPPPIRESPLRTSARQRIEPPRPGSRRVSSQPPTADVHARSSISESRRTLNDFVGRYQQQQFPDDASTGTQSRRLMRGRDAASRSGASGAEHAQFARSSSRTRVPRQGNGRELFARIHGLGIDERKEELEEHQQESPSPNENGSEDVPWDTSRALPLGQKNQHVHIYEQEILGASVEGLRAWSLPPLQHPVSPWQWEYPVGDTTGSIRPIFDGRNPDLPYYIPPIGITALIPSRSPDRVLNVTEAEAITFEAHMQAAAQAASGVTVEDLAQEFLSVSQLQRKSLSSDGISETLFDYFFDYAEDSLWLLVAAVHVWGRKGQRWVLIPQRIEAGGRVLVARAVWIDGAIRAGRCIAPMQSFRARIVPLRARTWN